MAPKISISLNPPYNGEFYSSNDQMSGIVSLQLTKALSIRKISVILKGFSETLTKIDQEYMFQQNGMMMPGQDNKSFHTLMKFEQRVFLQIMYGMLLMAPPSRSKLNQVHIIIAFNLTSFPESLNV